MENKIRSDSMANQRIEILKEALSEKDKRSMKVRRMIDDEIIEKKWREFVVNQDKQHNIELITRQKQYEREMLNQKIQQDNNRSNKLRRDREEIMNAKQRLRREIDKDKQSILQDFDMIKQGKADPNDIAKKYGYVGHSSQDGGSLKDRHNERKNKKVSPIVRHNDISSNQHRAQTSVPTSNLNDIDKKEHRNKYGSFEEVNKRHV